MDTTEGFVVKYDSSGNYLWSFTLDAKPTKLTIDQNGDLITCATLNDLITDIDPGAGVYNVNLIGSEVFVAKYTPNGTFINFLFSIGGSTVHQINYLVFDQAGNIYIGGHYREIGDSIDLILAATPLIGDVDTSNNTQHYQFPVINSFDPNDKHVYPKGVSPLGNILNNQKMTYTVNFQNTSNADAVNIYILDTISSNLDLSSLRLITSSTSTQLAAALSGYILTRIMMS